MPRKPPDARLGGLAARLSSLPSVAPTVLTSPTVVDRPAPSSPTLSRVLSALVARSNVTSEHAVVPPFIGAHSYQLRFFETPLPGC